MRDKRPNTKKQKNIKPNNPSKPDTAPQSIDETRNSAQNPQDSPYEPSPKLNKKKLKDVQ